MGASRPTRWIPAAWIAAMCLVLVHTQAAVSQTMPTEFRTIDGTNNNLAHPDWGSANIELLRNERAFFGGESTGYSDGVSAPAGDTRPSARAVSNAVSAQLQSVPIDIPASDFVWQWGQFVDHDIDLTGSASPTEEFDIPVPAGDPFFDPADTGTAVIQFFRSTYLHDSVPREQMNEVTAWIDASNVYGSDEERAAELRRFRRGKLNMGRRRLLPFNVNGFPNAPNTDASYFLAGDVRANEQNALTAMHTLFMREHNYIVKKLRRQFRRLDDETAYQMARAIVIAEIQSITYNEFLPVLLGPNGLQPYHGYDPNVDPSISNLFSTAAYRFGHSMLSSTLLRFRRNGKTHRAGDLPLRDAFFNPDEIFRWGIEPLLRGLAKQRAQEIDTLVVDDVRNFLFGPPGAGGFDLAALNIQRGRDHGLPSYTQARLDVGLLTPIRSFADISSDPTVQARLASVYASVDDVDAWVGALAEDHLPNAKVGQFLFTVLVDQFTRLRDGDRFWYENYLPADLRARYVDGVRLSDIIRRNARIRKEIQDNVFLVE